MQVSAYRVRKNKKITEKIDDDENFLFVYEFRCYESKINDIKEIVLKLTNLFEKY